MRIEYSQLDHHQKGKLMANHEAADHRGPSGDRALGDVRVLDLAEGGAGSLAAALLGDFGADVVKVVGTDPRRQPSGHLPDWVVRNRSKRLALVDFDDVADRAAVANLIGGSDIVVTDSPDRLEAFGLKREDVAAHHLLLDVSPYVPGWTPWHGKAASAELLEAITGISGYQASYSGEHVASVYPYLTQLQAVWAACCAVAGLAEYRQTGEGQTVTVSGMHAALLFGEITFSRPIGEPEPDRAIGPAGLNPMYTRYQCSDGQWVFVGGLGPKFANRVVDLVGVRPLLDDPRVGGRIERLWAVENVPWVMAEFNARFAGLPAAEWIARLEKNDIPCTLLNSRDDWFRSEQMALLDQRVQVVDPILGEIHMPGTVVASRATPGTVSPAAEPVTVGDLGWHATAGEPVTDPRVEGTSHGPLDGYKVAVLGSFVAGPLTGRLLAELGVDAIKVEPLIGDPWRVQGFGINRGNRSIAIDLSGDVGRAALREVLADCDIVINNFRLGVMERLELDHDALAEVNPDIVTVAVTAFGERGPLSPRPGYDPVLQAASGMMTAQGGTGEPVALSLPPNDLTTAVCGAFAAVVGVYHRMMTGQGQHLSTALATTTVFLQAGDLVSYSGRPPGRSGGTDFLGPTPFDRFYSVQDGQIRLQAEHIDPARWQAAGLDLDEAAFEHDPAAAISRVLARFSRSEAVKRLTAAEVPAVSARRSGEVAEDPDLHRRGFMTTTTTRSGQPFILTGHYTGFERTETRPLLPPPGLGEHSTQLLRDAGLSEAAVEELLNTGALIEGQAMDITYLAPYR
ncbi:MAG: CoA transferase [Hyphomicrobiales bacterium]|nr:MAG: CoA transferase [Hyphomicrobiales bacterium]